MGNLPYLNGEKIYKAYLVPLTVYLSSVMHEPERQKTYLRKCAPNEYSDQPAHSRSLIRIFMGRILDSPGWKFFHAEKQVSHHTAQMRKLIWHYAKTPIQIYIENFTIKTKNFQMKYSDIFHVSAQNIDCGYSLEPPRRGGSNEYPRYMFSCKTRQIMYAPVNPSFTK